MSEHLPPSEPSRPEQPDAGPPLEPLPAETPGERRRRQLRHARLYLWAILLLAMVVVIVALIVSNTRQVPISWVFGDSTASLVWIVIVAFIVGWLAGVATSVLFRRRARPPRRADG